MTTPDWADEIAMGWKGGEVARGELAADFRAAFLRGRVAGLREAAEIAIKNGLGRGSHVVQAIRAAADKLEKGEE